MSQIAIYMTLVILSTVILLTSWITSIRIQNRSNKSVDVYENVSFYSWLVLVGLLILGPIWFIIQSLIQ